MSRHSVVIVSTVSLQHEPSPAVTNTTYTDALDELDDTRYDDKGTKEGNCPRPLGHIWEVMLGCLTGQLYIATILTKNTLQRYET